MRKLPRAARCIIKRRTKNGDASKLWIVPEELVGPEKVKSSEVHVWWERTARRVFEGKAIVAEHLVITQHNSAANTDAIVILTPGQVYDLIDALNRAVESL